MNNPADCTHQPSWLTISLNLIMLTLISLFAFSRNTAFLLLGNDGPTGYALAKEQLTFFGISPHLHTNPLQGLGNTSLPTNLSMQPGYWFGAFVHDGTLALALLYTWSACLLFISVLLIGWNYRFSIRINIISAWVITILAFPYFETVRIYNISAAMPSFVNIIIVFTMIDIGVQRVGTGTWTKTLFYTALILLGLILCLVLCPAALTLLVPLLTITTLLSLVNAKEKKTELLQKLTVLMTILIITFITGWLEYISGMLLYTVGVFFNDEIHGAYVNTATFTFASILFHGNTKGISWGPWLFCTSTLGTLYAIRYEPKYRVVALAVLLTQFLVVSTGVASAVFHPIKLASISIIYFEIILFPFYALFSVYLFSQLIKVRPTNMGWLDSITPILIVTIITVSLLQYHAKKKERNGFAVPPVSTPITALLESEIALHVNKPFSGRVATVIPGMNVREQFQYASEIAITSGNDHHSTGLWLKNIPTLHEYSQSLTPAFYRINRNLLSDGTDNPDRNLTSFNKMNLKILKLLGVRFILSTEANITNTKQRIKLVTDDHHKSLYLHELRGANTSGISAKRIILAKDLHEIEKIMATKEFDLQDAIVLKSSETIKENLSPASNSKLSIIKGGFRLQAASSGQTLLILPIEFSHCLSVTSLSGAAPKIIRVDLALTGVIFNHSVDVKLDNITGPFKNPRCRMVNYREFASLWKNKQSISHRKL